MTFRYPQAFLLSLSLALPLVTARAQMPYSPASPVNTSSPFAGVPLPNSAPAARNAPVQPGGYGTVAVNPGSSASAPQIMTSEPIDPGHKLGRGDRLSYHVVEDREPERNYELMVSDNGEVNLPVGGLVKAAGKSTDELIRDVKSRLEKDYYYHATVIMGLDSVAQRASRGRVYVTGAVHSIGPVELPLDAPMTASQAIYQMGGPVDFSYLKGTVILRKGGPPKGIPVNIKAVENGELDKDVVLQPGDVVKVPEDRISIHF